MRKDFFGCRDCGTWGPERFLINHNGKSGQCPICKSHIFHPLQSPLSTETPR